LGKNGERSNANSRQIEYIKSKFGESITIIKGTNQKLRDYGLCVWGIKQGGKKLGQIGLKRFVAGDDT